MCEFFFKKRKKPRKTVLAVNFRFYLLFNIHVAIVTRRFTFKCLQVIS